MKGGYEIIDLTYLGEIPLGGRIAIDAETFFLIKESILRYEFDTVLYNKPVKFLVNYAGTNILVTFNNIPYWNGEGFSESINEMYVSDIGVVTYVVDGHVLDGYSGFAVKKENSGANFMIGWFEI